VTSGPRTYWAPHDDHVTRLHLEETPAKMCTKVLPDVDRYSYVDLNPPHAAAEIVTDRLPHLLAGLDYVNPLRARMQGVGASEADMEKGNCRCEANVSVRRIGDRFERSRG